jgi:hypothetical protein
MDVPVDALDLVQSGGFGRIQNHVSDDCHTDASPMVIRQIHAPYTDRGPNPYQPRPRQQTSFGNRTEIVHLHFNSCETPCSGKMPMQRAAHGSVGNTRAHTAVQRARAVHQLGAQAALNGETVTVHTHQLESQQVIERVACEKISNVSCLPFGIAQVS